MNKDTLVAAGAYGLLFNTGIATIGERGNSDSKKEVFKIPVDEANSTGEMGVNANEYSPHCEKTDPASINTIDQFLAFRINN